MSKVLAASCEAGVVTCEGKVIAGAEILCEGIESSEGVLIIDQEKSYYLANTQPDLKEVIEALSVGLRVLDEIGAALNPVTVSPGSAAALINQLTVLTTAFVSKKDLLR